ncbi:hypothetical protein SAMN02745116_02589 [Pilibacter termitis]|uniref:Uncharacterized protein n=1 Tax=Pilibacter termitis TaxID=263852 RepID=A0A1T4RGN9_9ENTE|nr:hypothetical protein [Pilibacter termitis]SKA14898.1 hypothetical protein SAMN02745116_02589 [Pilibacter termitis]
MKSLWETEKEVAPLPCGETFMLSDISSEEFWNSDKNAYRVIRERWISEFKAMVLTGKLFGIMYLCQNENGENVYFKFA